MLSTHEVRDAVVSELPRWGWLTSEAEDEFDRWLNQVKAEVWDKAYRAGAFDMLRTLDEYKGFRRAIENPYRDNEEA